ncbi:uncharacterized protein LOC129131880 [Agelaius phoeniceus]|uniref:uncharacterized protein LOC129131880 n=1 Tax=Agelaius phoeniceus TaxID=39638 RepID=UPI004054DDB4
MSYSKPAQGDSETTGNTDEGWIEWIINLIRRWNREETNKAPESEVDKAFQGLDNKMKALHEDFKKLQEIRAELETNQGNKEQGIARVLKSMLNMNLRQLSRRIQTLAEDVEEWPAATKDELQLLKACLEMNKENKKEDIAKALASKLNMNLRQLSRRIKSVAEDVHDCLETTTDELELLRAELEANQGNKEEEIAVVLESNLNLGRRCNAKSRAHRG